MEKLRHNRKSADRYLIQLSAAKTPSALADRLSAGLSKVLGRQVAVDFTTEYPASQVDLEALRALAMRQLNSAARHPHARLDELKLRGDYSRAIAEFSLIAPEAVEPLARGLLTERGRTSRPEDSRSPVSIEIQDSWLNTEYQALIFGPGDAQVAERAERVIDHEYGHALQFASRSHGLPPGPTYSFTANAARGYEETVAEAYRLVREHGTDAPPEAQDVYAQLMADLDVPPAFHGAVFASDRALTPPGIGQRISGVVGGVRRIGARVRERFGTRGTSNADTMPSSTEAERPERRPETVPVDASPAAPELRSDASAPPPSAATHHAATRGFPPLSALRGGGTVDHTRRDTKEQPRPVRREVNHRPWSRPHPVDGRTSQAPDQLDQRI
jgi:hypothetical protein